MKFAILCLAATLAAVAAEIEPGMRTSNGRQQPSFDLEWTPEPTLDDGSAIQKQFASPPQQFGGSNFYPQYPPNYPPNYPPPNYPPPNYPPNSPSEPGRELPLSQDGSIKLRNDGLFTVLQFYVDYQLNGRKVRKESGKILTGLSRIITVPAAAQEITVTIQYVGLFDITSDIHVRQFKYPVIRCYMSKDGRNVNEVGC